MGDTDWRYKVPHYQSQKTKEHVCNEAAKTKKLKMTNEFSELYAAGGRKGGRRVVEKEFPYTRSYCAFDNRRTFGKPALDGALDGEDCKDVCVNPDYDNDDSYLKRYEDYKAGKQNQ